MKIRVENVAADVTDEELRMLFECFGNVASVERSGPGGTAVVEMPDREAAKEAVGGLDGQNLKGRELSVSDSRSQGGGPNRFRKPIRRRRRR